VPRNSRETLRRILREGKISWQATTTRKVSTDPDFVAKMHRVLALCDTPPTYGRAICVDEFSPLNFRYGGVMHSTHEEQNAAIAAYVRRRNARAEPKTDFAQDSPVRQWTQYPAEVA
jgi:hypothetical protein